jgi:hypothetical protein
MQSTPTVRCPSATALTVSAKHGASDHVSATSATASAMIIPAANELAGARVLGVEADGERIEEALTLDGIKVRPTRVFPCTSYHLIN